MASFFITGISRGLGYEFLRQYSADESNTVIGLVRNKAGTDKKISEDAELSKRSNIHIVEGDMCDYSSLQKAAAFTAKITGGSLDYLIGNAALQSQFDAYDDIGTLGEQPDELTRVMRESFDANVIGNIHLINIFLPLILKGDAKKVIILSTGLAHVELTNEYDVAPAPLYSISKAALNMMVAKFSARYKQEGVLFLALSPGVVDTGNYDAATPEQLEKAAKSMMAKFSLYAPEWKGPITPEQSVSLMQKVIADVSIEKGNGGGFLSHWGNQRWL